MKKKIWAAVAAAAVLAVFMSCQRPPTIQKKISNELHLDLRGAVVYAQSESHGGFHGDGVTYGALAFGDDALLRQIAENDDWKPLPLSENLTRLIRGLPAEKCDKARMQEVRNGWYYFLDRQSADPHDDTDVLDRHSYNFTIAVYDADGGVLYYVKMDT